MGGGSALGAETAGGVTIVQTVQDGLFHIIFFILQVRLVL